MTLDKRFHDGIILQDKMVVWCHITSSYKLTARLILNKFSLISFPQMWGTFNKKKESLILFMLFKSFQTSIPNSN